MKIACHTAISQLQDALEHPGQAQADAGVALQHIAGCPACKRRLAYLLEALRMEEQDQFTCAECQEQLPTYLAVPEQRGMGWRPLLIHLATCAHCAGVMAELRAMMALAHADQLALPPAYPAPDLGFLHAPAPGPRWRISAVGRLIIELADALLPQWQPLPAAATGLKSGSAGTETRQVILTNTPADLTVTLTVEPGHNTPGRCTLTVNVQIAGRSFPQLGGTTVIVRRARQPVESRLTNAFGEVIFADLAEAELPELSVEVAPEGVD